MKEHETSRADAPAHLEREYQAYGEHEYERLTSFCVAHLYNLRQRPKCYQQF